MAENFVDLENLYLDDNSYLAAPEGDYHFTVDGYDLDYSTSEKFPENTREVVVHMSVPVMIEGKAETVSVKKNLPVCSKMLWLLRQYFECIGLMPEKGRAKMPDLDKMIGCTGKFRLLQGVSAKGNEYNNIDHFYRPSEAPTVCDNDDVWDKKPAEGFQPADDAEVNPFV